MRKNLLILGLIVFTSTILKASIVYTDITPDTTYASGGYIDFNNDRVVEISIINGKYLGLNGCKIWTMGTTNPDSIIPKPLSLNTVINSNGNFAATVYASMDNWGNGTSFPLNVDAYIGFQFTVSGETYYGWMRAMWNGTNFIYKDYAYENTANTLILAGNSGGDTQGTYDIAMDSISMDTILLEGNISVKGRIRNMGSNAVDTFDVVYKIDAGSATTVYTVVAAQSISNNQTYDFTCNIPWEATTLGRHSIEIIVSNPDGNNDINNTNNSKSLNLWVLNEIFAKTVVCEEAGGTWCKFCPRGIVGLNSMSHNHPDSLWIGIAVHVNGECHSNYPGDPMVVSNYAVGIGTLLQNVPTGVVDRNSDKIINMTIPELEQVFVDCSAEIPLANIKISNQTWNSDDRSFTIETTTNFATDIASSNYRVSLVVLEDDVAGITAGWNQHDYFQGGSTTMVDWDGFNYNTEGTLVIEESTYVPATRMHYQHVARQLIGGWHGVESSIPASVNHGTPYIYTFTGSIPSIHNANNTSCVALLIDNTTGKIVNANKVKLINTVTIAENADNKSICVYPNPSRGIFKIGNAQGSQITIYNIIGQIVYKSLAIQKNETINLSILDAGGYIIKVANENSIITKHIIISR